ncbi:MAG: DinB family protein [Planctomycetaceae bacterium]
MTQEAGSCGNEKESMNAAAAATIDSWIEVWRERLKKIPHDTAHRKHSADRWSISEVVGHLIDSACNNHQRFVRAQFRDSLVFPKYDQNQWANAGHYLHADWGNLIELWYFYNKQIAIIIRDMDAAKLQTPCTITPYDTCTLQFLVTDYADHMIHHLNKIDERLTRD